MTSKLFFCELPLSHCIMSAAEADANGGPPHLVDIADDRLAVRVPNAADDANNFVLGAPEPLQSQPLLSQHPAAVNAVLI